MFAELDIPIEIHFSEIIDGIPSKAAIAVTTQITGHLYRYTAMRQHLNDPLLKGQLIRKASPPDVFPDITDTVRISWRTFPYRFHIRPPLRPPLGIDKMQPDYFNGGVY